MIDTPLLVLRLSVVTVGKKTGTKGYGYERGVVA